MTGLLVAGTSPREVLSLDRSWRFHQGDIGIYRRHFKLVAKDEAKHLKLQFDGIATHSTVWFNGTLVARYFCGYTSFHANVTPLAQYCYNLNIITVRVDANPMEGWWYEGGGSNRHTWLVKREPLHIVTDGGCREVARLHPPGDHRDEWRPFGAYQYFASNRCRRLQLLCGYGPPAGTVIQPPQNGIVTMTCSIRNSQPKQTCKPACFY